LTPAWSQAVGCSCAH
jgi:hypothetical protein